MNLHEWYKSRDKESVRLRETFNLIRKGLKRERETRRKLETENRQLRNLLAWLCEKMDVHGNIRR